MQAQEVMLSVGVDPAAPKHLQTWAHLATHVASTDDLYAISRAFCALWWESCAAETFGSAVSNWNEGDMSWVVVWHGHTITELQQSLSYWNEVLERLRHEPTSRAWARMLPETTQHVQELQSLVIQLIAQAVAVGRTYRVPLSERVYRGIATAGIEVDLEGVPQA